MNMYAKCDKKYYVVLSVMNIFTNGRTGGLTLRLWCGPKGRAIAYNISEFCESETSRNVTLCSVAAAMVFFVLRALNSPLNA